jgi:hypothetical protein
MFSRQFKLLPVVWLAGAAYAQPGAPSFEAASVKPSTPASSPGPEFNFAPNGGLAIRNGDLKGIIEMAFDSPRFPDRRRPRLDERRAL